MLIASKTIVNKSKLGTKFFIKHPMLLMTKLLWQSAAKPKSRKKLKKRPYIENKTERDNFMDIKALDKNLIVEQVQIKVEDPYNLAK